MNQYAKTIAAVVGTTVTALQPHYGGQWWFSILIAALTAAGVYGVSNSPPKA